MHSAIAARTFRAAGWSISISKLQIGTSLDELGLAISSEGDGALSIPEAKRQGLLVEISWHRPPLAVHPGVARPQLERLVGRLLHVATVMPASPPWLEALYRIKSYTIRHGHARAARPPGPAGRLFYLSYILCIAYPVWYGMVWYGRTARVYWGDGRLAW